MAQVKKAEVRVALLDAAFALFAERGYHATTVQAIAARAGVSAANVYVYFASKLDMLYAIYDPWMRDRLARLERELAAIRSPRERLRRLLRTVWRDIPDEENGFVVNIMQALSAATPVEGYRPVLVDWMEARVGRMIAAALPPARRAVVDADALAHLAIMALDGFAIYRRLNPGRPCDDRTLDAVCDLLLGVSSGAAVASSTNIGPADAPRSASRSASGAAGRAVARAVPLGPVRTASRSANPVRKHSGGIAAQASRLATSGRRPRPNKESSS